MLVGSVDARIIKSLKVGIVYLSFFVRGFILILISPYLSRVLSSTTWGSLITAQVAANWLSIIVDFGFVISAGTRLSVEREDKSVVKYIVSGVVSAKIFLSLTILVVGILLSEFSSVAALKTYAASIILLAIIQGLSPLWYFQAIEKLYIFSSFDLFFRLIFIGLIFMLIHEDADAALSLNLLAICLLLANGITSYIMWQKTSGWILTPHSAVFMLRGGFAVFIFTLTTSIYNSASVLMLSFFAMPVTVAIYGNADRIVRASIGVIGPLNQLFMPRSAREFSFSKESGVLLANKLLRLYAILGIISYIVVFSAADNIVSILYGERYVESTHVLRFLGILLPIVCINTVLSFHFLVPAQKYKSMTSIYIIVSLISAISILILVPRFQINGMIFSVIIPEICALIMLCLFTHYKIIKVSYEK